MRIHSSAVSFPILLILLTFTKNFAQKDNIFLCVDSMLAVKNRTGQEPTKLVYGYINGKRTDCMTEHELRTLFSKETFKKKDKEVKNKQKKTLEQNAVFRGEKNLQNADLRGMDLQGVNLSGADLSGAQLESADLRHADLSNTKLIGANLKNAYCKSTDFTGADFTDANLTATFFLHSDLTDTKGLTIENLSKVSTMYTAKIDSATLDIIEGHLASKFIKPKGTWAPAFFDNSVEKDTGKR